MVKIPRLQAQQKLSIENQPHIPMDAGTNVGKAISNLGSAIGGLGGALGKGGGGGGGADAAAREAAAEANHIAALEADRVQTEMSAELIRREAETDWTKAEANPDEWYNNEIARLNEASRAYQERVQPGDERGYRSLERHHENFRNRRILALEKKRKELAVMGKFRPVERVLNQRIQLFDIKQPMEPQIEGYMSYADKAINGLTGIGVDNKEKLREQAAKLIYGKMQEFAADNPKIVENARKALRKWVGIAADNASSVKKTRAGGAPLFPDAKERKSMRDVKSSTSDLSPTRTSRSLDYESPTLVNFVQRFEGFKPRAYWDYKQWTNGYGTRARSPNEVIDEAEARRRLSAELAEAASFVDRTVPKNTPTSIKFALAELTFNAGEKWASDGLGRAVQLGDWAEAKERYLQYNGVRDGNGNKQVLRGLMRRRMAGSTFFDDAIAGRSYELDNVPSNVGGYLISRLTSDKKGQTGHITGLQPVMQTRLAAFLQAAKEAGHDIRIVSGYRSKEHQARLYRDAIARYGSEAAARKWVAPPGRSRHNYGLAADLQYGDRGKGLGGTKTPAVEWAHANAARFGLHFRIPHEDWQIEPIGFGPGSVASSGGGGSYMALGGPTRMASAGETPPLPGVFAAATGAAARAPSVGANPVPFGADEEIEGGIESDDGGMPADRTITIQDDEGNWYNVPTIVDGKEIENPEAAFDEGTLTPVGGPYESSEEATAAVASATNDASLPLPTKRPLDGEILPPLPGRIERFGDDEIPGGPPQARTEPTEQPGQPVIANFDAALEGLPPGVLSHLIPMVMGAMPQWQKMYNDAVEEEQKQAARAEFFNQVVSGERIYNRNDPEENEIINEHFETARFKELGNRTLSEAILSKDVPTPVIQNVISQLVKSLNDVPKPIAEALETATQLRPSERQPEAINLRSRAYQVIRSIANNYPKAFEGRGLDKSIAEAMRFEYLTTKQGLSPAEALAKMEAGDDPQNVKLRELRQASLNKILKDTLTTDTIYSKIQPNYVLGARMSPNAREHMAVEFRDAYKEHYMEYGEEGAEEAAILAVKKRYGVSNILAPPGIMERGTLMRDPPEVNYPPIRIGQETSHDYLHQDLKTTVLEIYNEYNRAFRIRAAIANGQDPAKIKHEDLTDIDLRDVVIDLIPTRPQREEEKVAQIQAHKEWAQRAAPWMDYQRRKQDGALKDGEKEPPNPGPEPMVYSYPSYLVRLRNPNAGQPGEMPFITFPWGLSDKDIKRYKDAAHQAARQKQLENIQRPEDHEAEQRRRARRTPTPDRPPQPGDVEPPVIEPAMPADERERARKGRRSEGKMPFPKPGNEQRAKDRRKARRSGPGDKGRGQPGVENIIQGNPDYAPFRRPAGGGGE